MLSISCAEQDLLRRADDAHKPNCWCFDELETNPLILQENSLDEVRCFRKTNGLQGGSWQEFASKSIYPLEISAMSHYPKAGCPRQLRYQLLFYVLLVMLQQTSLHAQTVWNGSVGGSWNIDTNWTPNLVPTQLDDTIIDAGKSIIGTAIVATSRDLTIGDLNSGELLIQNGGSLTSFRALSGSQFGSTGTVTVDNSTWTILGETTVGNAANGTLSVMSGGTVDSVGRVTIGQGTGSVSEVTIDGNSSYLIAQGGLTVGDPNSGGTGTLNVRNNGKLSGGFFGDILVNASSTVNVETGGSIVLDFFTTEFGSQLNNHASIGDPNTSVLLSNLGAISGSGSQTGDLFDFGVVAPTAVSPADDTGVYTVDGAWNKQSGSELQIQLGGLSNGGGDKSQTTFDWIDLTGDLTLGGMLDVELTDGFTLGFLQEFVIVQVGGALSGTFDGLIEGSIVATLGGMKLQISYVGGDGNDVALYTPSQFSADFNRDNHVDELDLAQWELDYGVSAASDADYDGDSDGFDFLIWQQQLGSGLPLVGTSAVPEPSTIVLISMGLIATACYRGTRKISSDPTA
jgi:T5SS/PEP-CTERM-associated repeat protein